ncbi:MAG: aminopeptidase P N-terminal domain-containing protein [Candidatus Aminicenantes bacterium]|nr:aminopeptidase P N-terminal domain-containing protein [Candidatus Aminicenantes bacterium]
MTHRRRLFASLLALALAVPALGATGLRFDKSEYAARRARLMDKIADGTAVLFGAQPIASYYPYAQANDFLYLTGVELPNAALFVDGRTRTSSLFLTTTEAAVRAEGLDPAFAADPRACTGIERVLPAESLGPMLAALAGRGPLYVPFSPEELYREASREKASTFLGNATLNPWDGRLTREMQFVRMLKERFPQVEVRDLSPLVWDLRTIKSPAEIAVLRRAAAIGVKAHTEILKAARPGMREFELSAVLNYICEREGAQESAYGVIICSGENHPYLHYAKHDRLLREGDILVVDAGPDLDAYDIDITTSFPAGAAFTPRQKEVYEACLAVHEACLAVYRPGLTAAQCRQEVDEILKKKGFDLTKDYFRGMRGGFGHYVGMATHDVGGSPQALKPGMVFANEPLVVLAAEEIGIRVEDTVLITETGCENLTAGIPRSVKEIESAKKTDGIPQILKKSGR